MADRTVREQRRLIKFLLLIGLLLLLFGGGARAIVAGGAKSLDLADKLLGSGKGARLLLADQPYGRGARQSLDIWVPEQAQAGDRLPVVVFFSGGGWGSGELAWTHRHIGELGGDPDRIALMGHSAGAYNAVMLALDPEWMRAAKSDASVIRGVAGLAGPYDFLPFEKGGMADRAMGKVRPPERTQPIHYARGDAPPLWLASGDEDETGRPRNSRNLAAAIERLGGSATLRVYPGMGHTGIVMALAAPFRAKGPVLDEATDFLRGVTARRVAPAAGAQ